MLLKVLQCRGSLHPITKTYLAPNVHFPGEKAKVQKIKTTTTANRLSITQRSGAEHHSAPALPCLMAQGGGLVRPGGARRGVRCAGRTGSGRVEGGEAH